MPDGVHAVFFWCRPAKVIGSYVSTVAIPMSNLMTRRWGWAVKRRANQDVYVNFGALGNAEPPQGQSRIFKFPYFRAKNLPGLILCPCPRLPKAKISSNAIHGSPNAAEVADLIIWEIGDGAPDFWYVGNSHRALLPRVRGLGRRDRVNDRGARLVPHKVH